MTHHRSVSPRLRRLLGLSLAAALLTSPLLISASVAAEVVIAAPLAVKTTLPKGKTIKTYTSTDKKQQLILRDEGGHGDFFYYSYYHFNGKRYTLIRSFVASSSLPTVKWNKDHVSFQAQQPTGPQEIQLLQVDYYPAKSQVRTKVLSTEAVESSG